MFKISCFFWWVTFNSLGLHLAAIMTEEVTRPDPRLKQIAQKLKQLRVAKGYSSYEAFAFDHELPRVGYGRHEQGSNLTMNSLLRLLDIHQLSLAEFFSDL